MTQAPLASPDRISLPIGGEPSRHALNETTARGGEAPWWRRELQAARRRDYAYYIYHYRYLAGFIAIGLLSIVVELAILSLLPAAVPHHWRVALGFATGLALSLGLNVTANFHVPRRYLLRTSAWFIVISLGSFAINSWLVNMVHATTEVPYAWLRLGTAGALFAVAYALHCRFTFDQARNFGIAVYASETEDVSRIFDAVGHGCDHVHVDLVDRTVNPDCAPVNLERIAEARRLWRGYPIALHIMSREPRQWAERTWDAVDWYLFHCDAEEDLHDLIFDCRLRGKKAGVVWHQDGPTDRLMQMLPHVDFVMVLAIAQPGRSGQAMSDRGLAVARTLNDMRRLYHYDLMFDGGVNQTNIASVPGRYFVSASAVLNAPQPTAAARYLRLSTYRADEGRKVA